MYCKAVASIILSMITIMALPLFSQEVPEGFHDELITDDFLAPVGVAFPDSNLIYVWEQDGRVHVLRAGVKLQDPLLDIHAEVSAGGDHGMLGLALHPDFELNGYLYVSYVVDPHYLRFFGTDVYDPAIADTWDATIGRVTRYQVDTSDFTRIVEGSRKVILGAQLNDGIPVAAPAHGVGGLDFGTDGTLLVGTGDGTTWVGHHTGGDDYKEFGFDSLAKALGILPPGQDVGSLRSQQLDSYNGKILRIDPDSGEGLSSNPFFDPEDPHAARSKVWALGLRSPFRIRVRPGSGSTDPADGRPGVIYIGDVGSNQYEELNIAAEPGRNFGWPLYEGMALNRGFYDKQVPNPLQPFPLEQNSDCEEAYFRFNDLIRDPRKDHQIDRTHPCPVSGIIPDSIPVFVHERPAVAFGNSKNNPEQVWIPGYANDGTASALRIDDPRADIEGLPFDGISSIAGDFYTGSIFPGDWQDSYYHGDFSGWIKAMRYDTHGIDEIHAVQDFKTGGNSVVYLRFSPFEEALYYVVLDYSDRPNIYQLRRITFGGNPKPVARALAEPHFGPSPLTVSLSARASYDPGGEPVQYLWKLPGGKVSYQQDTQVVVSTIETGPVNMPVTLIVRDTAGLQDSTIQTISLNNTPPEVNIRSIPEDYLYPLNQGLIDLSLEAEVSDLEHPIDMLHYHWEIKLKHNDHFHVEFVDTNISSQVSLFALGSTTLDKHAYEINLTVTDPLGLQGSHTVVIEPDLTTGSDNLELDARQVQIFPNPFDDQLFVTCQDKPGKCQRRMMKIFNVLGMQVAKLALDSTSRQSLNVSALQSGIYFVVITEGPQILLSQKMIRR